MGSWSKGESREYRYVSRFDLDGYLLEGWTLASDKLHMPHGVFSVLIERRL